MASLSKDGGFIRLIGARLVPDEQEESPPGAAVAGRILDGLGFAKKPLTLTPQLLATNPLDRLLREGVPAAMCNRLKLGRTLDAVQASGCALLLSALALAVWVQARLAHHFAPLHTTSVSLHSDDVPASDAPALRLPHGSSKDQRPDLQQAV